VSIVLPSEMPQAKRHHQRHQRPTVDLVLLKMCEENEERNGTHYKLQYFFVLVLVKPLSFVMRKEQFCYLALVKV